MKNLLILVDKIGEKKETLATYLSKNIPNCAVFMARFEDLIYEIDGKNIKVMLAGLNKDITFFDLVYIRRAGKYSISAGSFAIALKHLGVKFIDSSFEEIGPLGSKFTLYLRLSAAGFPTIPSFFCFQENIKEYSKHIVKKFGLPLVVKDLQLERGQGVFLIKNISDFDNIPNKFKNGEDHEFMFQKFVKSNEEYRILVLRDKIGAFEEKIRTDPNEFRNNVALGAREEFIDINKIPPKIKDIAIRSAKELGIEVAGADITIDEKKEMLGDLRRKTIAKFESSGS